MDGSDVVTIGDSPYDAQAAVKATSLRSACYAADLRKLRCSKQAALTSIRVPRRYSHSSSNRSWPSEPLVARFKSSSPRPSAPLAVDEIAVVDSRLASVLDHGLARLLLGVFARSAGGGMACSTLGILERERGV